MPLGLLATLAGIFVPPRLRCRNPQVDDRAPVLGAADFGVGAQIADQNDLVDATCHDALRGNRRAPPLVPRLQPSAVCGPRAARALKTKKHTLVSAKGPHQGGGKRVAP